MADAAVPSSGVGGGGGGGGGFGAAGSAGPRGRGRRTMLKIILIGDQAVGKTALLNRYAHNLFNEYYKVWLCRQSNQGWIH